MDHIHMLDIGVAENEIGKFVQRVGQPEAQVVQTVDRGDLLQISVGLLERVFRICRARRWTLREISTSSSYTRDLIF